MENELRLNNWISVQFDQRKEIQVTVTNIEHLVNHGPEMLMRGIPINEEWLVKFGFVNNIFRFVKFSFYLTVKPNGKIFYEWNGGNIEIEFVHQLQNLFYCLVGKELIIVNK